MVETIDFKMMMDGLMTGSKDKDTDSFRATKIEMVKVVTDLGFDGVQVKSFFKPEARRRGC